MSPVEGSIAEICLFGVGLLKHAIVGGRAANIVPVGGMNADRLIWAHGRDRTDDIGHWDRQYC
jgi:hypothetical protein